MADKMIAYCGLVCSECEAYQATQANDMPALEALAVRWSAEFNGDLKAADCLCDGCLGEGRQIGHCAECGIRACALEHGRRQLRGLRGFRLRADRRLHDHGASGAGHVGSAAQHTAINLAGTGCAPSLPDSPPKSRLQPSDLCYTR